MHELREADEQAWHAYERSLLQRNLSAETLLNYRYTIERLSAALPGPVLDATPGQVQDWLAGLSGQAADSTVATWFRRAATFYAWAARTGLADANPMAGMREPAEGEALIPVPDVADLVKVMEACAGRDFRSRRDLAIMRLMLETGTPRASAIAALPLTAPDLRHDQITVLDKGRKERTVPLGVKSGQALMLYLRVRAKHPKAAVPRLFIGPRGPMTRDGIYQVLARRCQLAGVPVISPHKWRHYSAHTWLKNGGSEGDAMKLFGWKTRAMIDRYAAALAADRAVEHAREAALADQV